MHSIKGGLRQLTDIVAEAMEKRASDIHITPGRPVFFRIDGELTPSDSRDIEPEETMSFLEDYLEAKQRARFDERKSYDASVEMTEVGTRARLHFYMSMDAVCLICRIVPLFPRKINELMIPYVVNQWASKRGIVIVSGLANEGKTTTLAALVDHINETRCEKIVILEDPIEYVHPNKKSLIDSREVGRDCPTWDDGLKDMSRENTDTVVVGEIRNFQAMDAVFGMAENGAKVYTSVHATGAIETIEKIVSLYNPSDHNNVRYQLSRLINGISSQWLVRTKSKKGRVLACELLTCEDNIRRMIREDKILQINNILEQGDGDKHCTRGKAIERLEARGLI